MRGSYDVYVYHQHTWDGGFMPSPPEYHRYTFNKTADGQFLVVSKQVENNIPRWVRDYINFVESLKTNIRDDGSGYLQYDIDTKVALAAIETYGIEVFVCPWGLSVCEDCSGTLRTLRGDICDWCVKGQVYELLNVAFEAFKPS